MDEKTFLERFGEMLEGIEAEMNLDWRLILKLRENLNVE